MSARALALALAAAAALLGPPAAAAPRALASLDGRPDAVVDLRTREGTDLVRGQWRYQDARLVEVSFRGPGPDLRPSGPPVATHDYTPRAGAADFDDSAWPAVAPEALEARRGTGRLAFGWYRIAVTIPARVGRFDPTGATVVVEVVVDDYAEVWVDGALPRVLGQVGGAVIGGFNAPNRVVVARDARPGQRIQLAVFAINGPLSDPPANFVWIRSATLDFYAPGAGRGPAAGEVVRLDPALDAIVPRGAVVEQLADGFRFAEGSAWVHDGGYLLVSDPAANTVYRWSAEAGVGVFRTKSGYTGPDIGEYRKPGANGLALDRDGRLALAEHGNRRVTRLEKNGALTVLADRYRGRRLNSPNDLVYRSDGSLYFTDPPFGLPRAHGDPRRELDYSGVFRWSAAGLERLAADLSGPTGLAFSPDERHLYVANRDAARTVVMRYPVATGGGLGAGEVLLDLTAAPGAEALGGVKVDRQGHLYVAGPGGLWIVSPAGTPLGLVRTPEPPSNAAWGDPDGRALYLTARGALYRLRLAVPGAGR